MKDEERHIQLNKQCDLDSVQARQKTILDNDSVNG